MTTPNPGDLCRFVRIADRLLVEHDATCDEFAAGVITDPATNHVVEMGGAR